MKAVTMLALTAAPAVAWVTKSQSVYGAQISEIQDLMKGKAVSRDVRAQLGYLWTYPANVDDDNGLGGGITYAFNPKLCDKLNMVNTEDTFLFTLVNCDSFKSSIASAFNTWAGNSRHLKFVDVSLECDALEKNFGPPTDPRQTHKYPHGGCPLAEIWITSMGTAASRRSLAETANASTSAFGVYTHEGGLHGLDLAHHITSDGALSPAGGGVSGLFHAVRRSLFSGRSLQEGPIETIYSNQEGASTAVATALSHARYSTGNPMGFRYTNGEKPFTLGDDGVTKVYGRPVVETYAGTFSFNVDGPVCWYLDSQFCYGIHLFKAQIGNAASTRLTIDGITFGLMALGAAFYAILVIRLACKVTGLNDADENGDGAVDADEDGDGKVSCCERMNHVFHEMADWNPLVLAFFVCIIICPIMFSLYIFAPCFNCYDFEAAATHEIGHFLGLGHPDNIPSNWASAYSYAQPKAGENSYNEFLASGKRPLAGDTCFKMWESVKAGVPAGASTDSALLTAENSGEYPFRQAQMQAFTQHNPNTCLTDDDLEGLNVLYPDCGEASLVKNVCHLTNKNIGFVRIMIYLFTPGVIGLVIVMIFSSFFHAWERHRNEKIRKERAELKVTNQKLSTDLASAEETAQKAIKIAKQQKKKADESSKKARSSMVAAKFQVAAVKAKAQDVPVTEVEVATESAV